MNILVTIDVGLGSGIGPNVKVSSNVGTLEYTVTVAELLAGIELTFEDTATYLILESLGACLSVQYLTIDYCTTSTTTTSSSTTTTTTTYCDVDLIVDNVEYYTTSTTSSSTSTSTSSTSSTTSTSTSSTSTTTSSSTTTTTSSSSTTTTTTTLYGSITYGLFSWSITAETGEKMTTKKDIAQTIEGHYGTVTSVEFDLNKFGSPDFNLTCYLYDGLPNVAYSQSLSELTLLGTSNTIAASDVINDWNSFSFSNINVGSYYTIVLRVEDEVTNDTSNTIGYIYDLASTFTDGGAWYYAFSSWYDWSDNDFKVRITYTDEPTTTTTTTAL